MSAPGTVNSPRFEYELSKQKETEYEEWDSLILCKQMASVSIYCDFCLKYGIKVYNVCRKVQADIEPSLGATMIMDLVSDLIKLRVNKVAR